MKFKDLKIGDEFTFAPGHSATLTWVKTSMRKYCPVDTVGLLHEHLVGSVNYPVVRTKEWKVEAARAEKKE